MLRAVENVAGDVDASTRAVLDAVYPLKRVFSPPLFGFFRLTHA